MTRIFPSWPELEAIVARRHALGQDRFDEVWEGNYHMAPAPHLWHAYLGGQLAVVLQSQAALAGLQYTDPFNLGEPDNYRVPDAGLHRSLPNVAFVPTAAMVIEIVSPGDESWEKFDHFAAHGVDEVLIVDPVEATNAIFVRRGDTYARADASELLRVSAGAAPRIHHVAKRRRSRPGRRFEDLTAVCGRYASRSLFS